MIKLGVDPLRPSPFEATRRGSVLGKGRHLRGRFRRALVGLAGLTMAASLSVVRLMQSG